MNLKQITQDILETIATEYEGQDFFDALHEIVDSREEVIYYNQAGQVVEAAWGCDIDTAEEWLECCYGSSIYEGCRGIHECHARLAYAILYTMTAELHQEEAA